MNNSRRDLLTWTASAAAASALASFTRPRNSGSPAPARNASPTEVEELVRWIVTTSREPAVQRGARELAKGLAPSTLLGAVLVAAARKVEPLGAHLVHAASVVSSIDELVRNATDDERAANVLWSLDFLKGTQEDQEEPGAWMWKPVDAQRVPQGDRARQALVDALELWDVEAADVAIVGFVRSAPLAVVYECLWEYGTRCRGNIGHKAIYAAQSRRALPLAGAEHAEEVARTLVRTYLLFPSRRTENASAFEKSREILAHGPIRKKESTPGDLGAARELLAELRRADHDALPGIVAALLQHGASSATLWDAVVMAASEITVGHAGGGPLHAFTSTNALHHIALHAPNDRLATLALLQSAAWVRMFGSGPNAANAFRIDELAPLAAPDGNVLTGTRAEIGQRAATVGRSEADSERFRMKAMALVRGKANAVHEFKLSVAALEESRRVGSWARPAVLAALAVHLPDPARADGEQLVRIREALAGAR